MAKALQKPKSQDTSDFAKLLDEYTELKAGSIVKGTIVGFTSDDVIVEVGLKSEAHVPLREFGHDARNELKEGDIIDVYVERLDSRSGQTMLSREKARREEAWERLEKQSKAGEQVIGTIYNKVKGGFTVDLSGAVAFLPSSQLDVRPIRDIGALFGKPQPFAILKMDRKRGNIVVSRRAVLEGGSEESRDTNTSQFAEGQRVKGTVKNITDYGAFVDLGGIDGLLHVTDISWKRVGHPSEVLKVGQQIDVCITRVDSNNGRISLGMKQLESNPWEGLDSNITVNSKHKGKITSLTDYGAFVELPGGIEGLVHVSEMSWTKKNAHPSKLVNVGDEVDVMVIGIDADKRRLSLGIKQCQENPWANFAKSHKESDVLEGTINNITEFGLFVGITDQIDGMVHLSDLSWSESGEAAIKNYKKGDKVQVKILEINANNERVALGIKQLTDAPEGYDPTPAKKNQVVTVTVTKVDDKGLEVTLSSGQAGFIKKADLSRDRGDQRTDRFAVGERLDAKILAAPAKKGGAVNLSIKALEIEEERKAMAEFGSSDSGASLGDILGAALKKKEEKGKKSEE